ncbi:MAG: MmgE/PrpD family protein [Betaproteobacteria bacterium]|nr:MmgE/PrpD family protein [Betaproteobacteria bacterium]
MDSTLKKITDFTTQLSYSDLTPLAVHECKRRVVDTLACALGGFNAEPSKIARSIARKATSENSARILGTLERSSPELAAFANGVMIRYLDVNDATGSGGGHPSDAFAALLAAAETSKIDGKTFITAAVIVYELYLGFVAAVRIRNRGWDHVVYTVLAAAAGVARIKQLDYQATANALSLALTPNMALEVVRRGQLSMWKGCAGANASRNALFAVELAAEGMTAPGQVFEGEQGVWNATGKFEWPSFARQDRPFRIADSQIKIYPCEYHGQAPVEATLAIRSQINPEDIESIVVRTYWFAWSEIGSEPEKWKPTTRETADHSIPFLVCAALLDGKVDASTFSAARISDSCLLSLIQKVQVIHDKELDKLQPLANPCRLEITLKNGEKKFSSVDYPKGHVKNPASDQDIKDKLVNLNNGLLSPRQISQLLDICWRLDELDDIGELVSVIRI